MAMGWVCKVFDRRNLKKCIKSENQKKVVEIQDSLKEIESQLDALQNKKTILEEKSLHSET